MHLGTVASSCHTAAQRAGALEAEAEEPSWAKEYRHRGLLKGLKPDWFTVVYNF